MYLDGVFFSETGELLGFLLGQCLNFKLFGITYLVGKIKFKLFFFRFHWLSEGLKRRRFLFVKKLPHKLIGTGLGSS